MATWTRPRDGEGQKATEVAHYARWTSGGSMDAAAIPANLGVNPSLTIAALAERFGARFPVKRR